MRMNKVGSFVFVLVVGLFLFCGAARGERDYRKSSDRVDELVGAKLKSAGIEASLTCSDEVFVRRVYLDMLGTLPQPKAVRAFLTSNAANRREKLIEQLFDQPEYADYWSLKWCDLLRVKAEFPSNLWPNAVQAYHRWLWAAMRDNMPYNEFAAALLTSSGSNFRVAPVNFYRALAKREPPEIAGAAALLFMGTRMESFTPEQRMGMAAFFGSVGYKQTAEWKEEIVYFDATKKFLDPATEKPVSPSFPDGTPVEIADGQDPRKVFAVWLIRGDNEWFARNIVNRMWFWLLGRGIVHEPDDMRSDNPPSNPELLHFLADELVQSGYDLRHIFRTILYSETYQRSAIQNDSNKDDEVLFSRYYVRRLDAEVLIDAICQITGTQEEYSSAIPEPFTWIPANQRSIALADGSISSPFLDLFGRPPRDTGFESERNNIPSSSQVLHMLNSSHIRDKLDRSPLLNTMRKGNGKDGKNKKVKNSGWGQRTPDQVLEQVYLTILSRFPTDAEKETSLEYVRNSGLPPLNSVVDIMWALINTKEFAFKH